MSNSEAGSLLPGVQSEFILLVGVDGEGKASKQRPTHDTNWKREREKA